MAMAARQNSTPSFCNFLKEGVLLPRRNQRLFAAVCAIIIASSSLLLLANNLAVQPLADEIRLDVKALNSTEPSSPDYARLLEEIKDDTKELLLVSAAYLLFAVVIGSAIRIVVLFAAVETYSGEQHTFGALLGKAKAQLKGPVVTLAFVYVLEIAYVGLLAAVAALVVILMVKQYFVMFLVGLLLVLAAAIFLVYFSFICSFSVLVAVAEPGCHGAGAFGRAWRLVKGEKWQVMLYVAVIGALATAISLLHTLAKTCGHNSLAFGLLLLFVYVTLMAVVQLFAVCAMTAFYYERRDSNQPVATGYVKISTEEANA